MGSSIVQQLQAKLAPLLLGGEAPEMPSHLVVRDTWECLTPGGVLLPVVVLDTWWCLTPTLLHLVVRGTW